MFVLWQSNKIQLILALCIGIGLATVLSQCISEVPPIPFEYNLRKDWPVPIIPDNNPLYSESIALGKSLFFDNALSIDSTISCSSCHHPQNGFSDARPLSIGVSGRLGFRNSGTLTNVAYLPYLNRDGGVKSLDLFAAVPIEDHQEMGFNLLAASQRLHQNKDYNKVALKVYNRPLDGFVITRSIASYLRTFISDNSLYDQYIHEENGVAFTAAQKRGMDLFFGPKAKCSTCHSGILFTDFSFQNNGLKNDYTLKDRGRQRITLDPKDEGKFRVASLRNVGLTAPYMHDGSLPDLNSVLKHYATHGNVHPTKNPVIDSINITTDEQHDIIAFLQTLTDADFINNPMFLKQSNY